MAGGSCGVAQLGAGGVSEAELEDSENFLFGAGIGLGVVAGGDDEFGLGGGEVGAPVADDAVGAVRSVAATSVADDGVVFHAFFEGDCGEGVEDGGVGRKGVEAGDAGAQKGVAFEGVAEGVEEAALELDEVGGHADEPAGEAGVGGICHAGATMRGGDEDDLADVGKRGPEEVAPEFGDVVGGEVHLLEGDGGNLVPEVGADVGDEDAGDDTTHAVADDVEVAPGTLAVGFADEGHVFLDHGGGDGDGCSGGVVGVQELEFPAEDGVAHGFVGEVAPDDGG